MKGWCPRDDRVVDAPDGRCPDCGTALVSMTGRERVDTGPVVLVPDADTVEEAPREPAPKASPPRANKDVARIEFATPAIAGLAIAIVLVAFLAGLALPRVRAQRDTGSVALARSDYSVGVEENEAGVPIRLDRVTQRGSRIIARFVVADDAPLAIGGLQTAVVRTLVGSQRSAPVRLETRATTDGFVLDGSVLERRDVAVTGIEILALSGVGGDGGAEFDLSIRSVWPDRSGPKAASIGKTRTLGDGRRLTIVGMVGWPDRLDLGLRLDGARAGWEYEDRYSITMAEKRQAGRRAGEVLAEPGTSNVRHVIFRMSPREAQTATLSIAYGAVTIRGGWLWQFA